MGDKVIEGMEALRSAEVLWLADKLAVTIAILAYPVGCGNSPMPEWSKQVATVIFERYAKLVELAARGHVIRASDLPTP